MLNLKFIIENIEKVIEKLNTRTGDFSYLNKLLVLNIKKKKLIFNIETLRYQQNKISKEISILKQNKTNTENIFERSIFLKNEIHVLENDFKKTDSEISEILNNIPNLPHESVILLSKDNNKINFKKYLSPKKFNFNIKDHVTLGRNLNILDFDRASKITGSRFIVYKGLGARLERSLIQFMMDLHSEKGYIEIIPPFIVNDISMFSTGQLPKFKNDSYRLENSNNWYLNPTGEVPAINLHRNEVLSQKNLPLNYVVFTTCFRQEAGTAGKDTRGILRQHQFNKVELIKFTEPQDSYLELENMLQDAESVLQKLELPYRVIMLPSHELGFSASKTYDIEVWLPGSNNYREISSISNTESFQSLRANIKFYSKNKGKNKYVHTLNGSGLAIGRTLIAILENYQNKDGTITVPKVLRSYMRTDIIK
ncbi:Seryl-tRNA synthetase [Candidatus Phytoplasma mali]|uniref:Serine--tRNA ligase n=1 Tax=Phytoplasma mali (strain AT) TaxID=482235 RepID=SYS_PHYMT|nr:serine--tRNA ligase [Candidatus Phytoplasma mali]B3R0F5.1 RecName: Full=Serine--tRNA ligase; AltName: Full=Seryl-tRNA synthetase; Short=SerRS; AltName: Full=Seryl-tRNA(Ser/Sec) synthetase [Candidatus Phytoplasma mali AT]CAP18319.1 Seryl-tRNA synthetase [Candidatus Phytoplasma mali]